MFNAWTVFGLVPVPVFKLSLAESANFSNIFEDRTPEQIRIWNLIRNTGTVYHF
jgi:hypothetical protein